MSKNQPHIIPDCIAMAGIRSAVADKAELFVIMDHMVLTGKDHSLFPLLPGRLDQGFHEHFRDSLSSVLRQNIQSEYGLVGPVWIM